MRRVRASQFTTWRLVSFVGGMCVLWIAVGSPLDGFADVLLSAHMVEHLLLMSAAPPLLLYGLPAVPFLRGVPRFVLAYLVAPLLRWPFLRRLTDWLVTPLVAWLAMNLTFLGWHVPAAFDFALDHESWHAVEHLCFLVSSLMFWWCIVRPWPAPPQPRNWEILFYLLASDVINTMLSAFLAFCGRPVYKFYLTSPNPFHVSPSEDQTLGAALMWVFGSIVFLLPVIRIILREVGSTPEHATSKIAPARAVLKDSLITATCNLPVGRGPVLRRRE
jgi:cytochrome c oxidase assembly factor CtaG